MTKSRPLVFALSAGIMRQTSDYAGLTTTAYIETKISLLIFPDIQEKTRISGNSGNYPRYDGLARLISQITLKQKHGMNIVRLVLPALSASTTEPLLVILFRSQTWCEYPVLMVYFPNDFHDFLPEFRKVEIAYYISLYPKF